jgi:hypothetical protein
LSSLAQLRDYVFSFLNIEDLPHGVLCRYALRQSANSRRILAPAELFLDDLKQSFNFTAASIETAMTLTVLLLRSNGKVDLL